MLLYPFVPQARTRVAKGPYRMGERQGPGKPDAKPRDKTPRRSGSIDGLAAGLQAPGTEGSAFWNQPSHRPLEVSGGDDGASKDTADCEREDAEQGASLLPLWLRPSAARPRWGLRASVVQRGPFRDWALPGVLCGSARGHSDPHGSAWAKAHPTNDHVCATVEKLKHPASQKFFIPSGTRGYAILRRCPCTEFRHDSCNTEHG
jgi:hypothetical protein